jgi:hypothetical protein
MANRNLKLSEELRAEIYKEVRFFHYPVFQNQFLDCIPKNQHNPNGFELIGIYKARRGTVFME